MTKSAFSLVTFTCGHSVPQGRGGAESFRPYPCQDCATPESIAATPDCREWAYSMHMRRLAKTLRQIRTVHELDQAIRDLRFSKRYALGLPAALAELDALYAEREALR